ncbi:MAG: phosphoribosylamine--glycine ligase [Candidatus Rokubacteria bacterium]|nr:phosphoribosylamine--glycine ligase [Candidatus Rokubacteria bacterium]
MRLLVVGSGGREHALAWKIARSPEVSKLYAAPGNPGIARVAECAPIKAEALDDLTAFAARERIDLAVVGPELPLTLGLADRLADRGVAVFGPSRAAAELEGSKVFAKELMAKYGVPTARFAVFAEAVEARAYVRTLGAPLVVKADGLAGGKGALVCRSLAEADEAIRAMLEGKVFGRAGERVVIEECLEGEEVSFFALTDGEQALPLAFAQDHKPVFDGDQGPNTGGMGAYSPVPTLGERLADELLETVVTPTLRAMAAEGRPYRGLLYVGLMLTRDGPRVLEFNCRFGDPETQPLMLRLDGDLVPLLAAVARGEGLPPRLHWRPEAAVTVVLASGGYPGEYATGKPIAGLEAAEELPGVVIFHAGTALREGRLVTAGGRVLGVSALGADLEAAVETAYEAASRISFEGMHYRRDIGQRALRRPPGR